MKKRFAILMAVMLFFTISACENKRTKNTNADGSAESIGKESIQNTKEKVIVDDSVRTTLVDSEHAEWPKAIMQPDMPEYSAGKLKGWNQWDDSNKDNIFILIDDTDKSDLEKYIIDLKAAGFEATDSDTFRKGIYTVEFKFNGDKVLQISSEKEKTLAWPKDFLVGVPELKKGVITDVTEPNSDTPDDVQLYVINLTKEDLTTWLKDLEAAGFKVEGENAASKDNMKLKEKPYKSMYMQFQENGANEWMIDFSYSE